MKKNLLIAITLLLTIISCQKEVINKEKILKIETSATAQSGQSILSITQDSIRYFSTQMDVGIARKNTPEDWKNLLKTFELEDFKKLKQGREHLMYDGTDEMLGITTNKGEYSIRNPYEDSINFKKIEALVKELGKIESKITEKQTIK